MSPQDLDSKTGTILFKTVVICKILKDCHQLYKITVQITVSISHIDDIPTLYSYYNFIYHNIIL